MRSFKRGKHKAHPYDEAAPRKTLTGAVLAQWVINIVLIVLICILFGLQAQTSAYLQGRGQFADREREQQRLFICELIGQLEAPKDSQLWRLAERLGCTERPLTPTPGAANSTSPVPIVGDETPFTSDAAQPTPGAKATASGQATAGNGATGTKVPASPSATPLATRPRTTGPTLSAPPSSQPPPEDPGGGLAVCIPLTTLCVNL